MAFVSLMLAPDDDHDMLSLHPGRWRMEQHTYKLPAWQYDTARRGSPVGNGSNALCSVGQEQLPDPKVVARCPVFSLGVPVVEFAHQSHSLQTQDAAS